MCLLPLHATLPCPGTVHFHAHWCRVTRITRKEMQSLPPATPCHPPIPKCRTLAIQKHQHNSMFCWQLEKKFISCFDQVSGVDSSPPDGVSSSAMEEIEPPAGLYFSMLQPNTDQSLGTSLQQRGRKEPFFSCLRAPGCLNPGAAFGSQFPDVKVPNLYSYLSSNVSLRTVQKAGLRSRSHFGGSESLHFGSYKPNKVCPKKCRLRQAGS